MGGQLTETEWLFLGFRGCGERTYCTMSPSDNQTVLEKLCFKDRLQIGLMDWLVANSHPLSTLRERPVLRWC